MEQFNADANQCRELTNGGAVLSDGSLVPVLIIYNWPHDKVTGICYMGCNGVAKCSIAEVVEFTKKRPFSSY